MSNLKTIIGQYGLEKFNSLTKYPSILTLHEMGERGRLSNGLTTSLDGELMYASEKIDGTNVRIIFCGHDFIIGSRENLLYHNGDTFYDPAQGIVENVLTLVDFKRILPQGNTFTSAIKVMYGELYGGKIHANSKQYGSTSDYGFRVFDVVNFLDISDVTDILEKQIEDISRWRERLTPDGLVYGQPFLNVEQLKFFAHLNGLELVPSIEFELGNDLSHAAIFEKLQKFIPKTKAALSDSAGMNPEGIVLRNSNRTKIFKLRFEDYKKTLNIK